MKNLVLRKQPSLISATSKDAVMHTILKKAEEYENNEARLKDYIGKSFNDIQVVINDLKVEKADIEMRMAKAEEARSDLLSMVADTFKELGIDKLTDKTSNVCSSISIVDRVEEEVITKEVKLSTKEALDLLEVNGLVTTKIIEEVKPSKKSTLKMNYKKGMKIADYKTKDAKEEALNRLEKLALDEDELAILR